MGFSRHVSRCEKDSAVAIPRMVAKCGAKDTKTPQRSGVPNGQSDLWHDFAAGCKLCKYVVYIIYYVCLIPCFSCAFFYLKSLNDQRVYAEDVR